MASILILVASILLLCIIAEKFSGKFGMPALILFMAIGMLFGCDGILKIQFDDYSFAEQICSIALSFIMFYGGFNTKWKTAKKVAARAVALSTIGVVITAALTCIFCYFILDFTFIESYLIGAVISSTDAASVFSILRKKNLNLKDGTAPLLEIESGSNDPASYLLTIIGIALLNSGEALNPVSLCGLIFTQLFFGILVGVIFAYIGISILTKTKIVSDGLDTIFMIALIIFAFGLSMLTNGNAFLTVYLLGIILGNSKIKNKKVTIPFFDGITGLAQILIFFLLGLLAFPHRFTEIAVSAFLITLFLTLVARPVAIFGLLLPFKCSIKQCLLVSWSGLRGAASIVFSIMVVASNDNISFDIFHIVFMVALFSVAIQGTLIPKIAELLNMVDDSDDVRKTFNDYQEESAITLMRMFIPEGHNWENRTLSEINTPTDSLVIMIMRNDETIIPRGDTVILSGDSVILSVPAYEPSGQENLEEISITKDHDWCDKHIHELNLPSNLLIALIKRGDNNLIPSGDTLIHENDIVVTCR